MARAKAVLVKLITDFPGHPSATQWSIRLGVVDCSPFLDDTEHAKRLPCIKPLRRILEAEVRNGDIGAEEEIRLVFGQVGHLMVERYPNLFGDFNYEDVDGHPHFVPEASKV